METMSKSSFESYPPLFRPVDSTPTPTPTPTPNSSVGLEEQYYSLAGTGTESTDSDPLPVIDLDCIDHVKLGQACRDWGLFRLVNHGMPTTFLNQLQDEAKRLFSRPFHDKEAMFTTPIAYFWGTPALTSSGVALQRGPLDQNINWVEGFNVPPAYPTAQLHPQDPMHLSFGLLLQDYRRHQARIAETIFEAVAKNLKLTAEQSRSYVSPSTGIIRLYRYPCCPEPGRAWGMDIHTDSSVFSILKQDHVGGLQLLKDGKWLDVQPIPNAIIVNVGDLLQAMSDDEYRSVTHRVKVSKCEERVSIGYFVFPEEDTLIQSSKYKPFTYADFRAQVQQDLRTTGVKVGLDRFRLTESSVD